MYRLILILWSFVILELVEDLMFYMFIYVCILHCACYEVLLGSRRIYWWILALRWYFRFSFSNRVHTNLDNLGDREKRLSHQVIREKAFFEEISGRNMLSDWSLNAFYVYLVPPLHYGNLNYSVSIVLYFSIWFLITKIF